MPKNDLNVTLKGIDELLFSTEEQRQEEKREQVQQIPIDELHPFMKGGSAHDSILEKE